MDVIADLARPFLDGTPTSQAAAVDQFRVRLAELLHAEVAAKGLDTPPIEVVRPGRPMLVVDVAVWPTAELPSSLPDKIQKLYRGVGRYRERHAAADLAQFVVVAGRHPVDLEPIAAGLGRLGLSRIAVCVAAESPSWYRLGGIEFEPLPDLNATVSHLLGTEPSPPPSQPARAEPRPEPVVPRLRVLLVGDEWRSSTGGISTVNRELAIALAAAGAEVHALVPRAGAGLREEARAAGVHLVAPVELPGLSDRELLLLPAGCAVCAGGFEPDLIVGHGRVLGPLALAVCRSHYPRARRLHIVHTDAERLEGAKEVPGGASRMATAAQRRRLEEELAETADCIAGVGPLLARTIRNGLRDGQGPRTVLNLVPGLRDWGRVADPEDPPEERQVLLLARAEDSASKGLDYAVDAVRRAVDRLRGGAGARPRLIIRGVQAADDATVKDGLDALRKLAPGVEVTRREYTSDPDDLRRDLFGSAVVIMPSRHEGFGLAAYEAIAAGVPVLITSNSGLAELLRGLPADGGRPVQREIVPMDGTDDEIAERWGEALARALEDPRAAFRRARELRSQIIERYTWERTVAQILALVT
ncbi:glycosyltransferase family 4 protein [Dactylosporangium sp. CS-033363]|uniref:glycosyltransferase family 4 protein n=1 Tax=Dactylosporangium sp. CS-033363 TaxID=3239935 RepID=UPI003D92029E